MCVFFSGGSQSTYESAKEVYNKELLTNEELRYKNLVESEFSIPVPVSLVKSSGGEDDDRWAIEGAASVEVPDLDDEVLVVKGMDISYLESHGLINWDHGKTPGAIIGEVEKAWKVLDRTPPELHVRGVLYKSNPLAREARQLMKALETDSVSGRRMQLSVEGKALSRENKRVVKSFITRVALTMQPINTATYAVLTKGICKHLEAEECVGCSESCMTKALVASSLSESGSNGATINCNKKRSSCCKDFKRKGLSREEAVSLLVQNRGYSKSMAERAVDLVFGLARKNFLQKED